MHIDELLAHFSLPQAEYKLTVPSNWAQGRTVFGGLSAALLFQSMKHQLSDDRELRSLSVNFVGPLNADEEFVITSDMLRQGKNASQIEARAMQNGRVSVVAIAVFAGQRESKVAVQNNTRHQMPIPKKPKFIPQIPRVTPKFLRHIDLSIHEGGIPFTGSAISHMHGWMRFKQAPEKITDTHLIALADAWPPAPLQMLRWPAPASTMSWNLEFIHPHRPIAPTDWIAYQAETRQAASGYAHTEANLWDSQGELIAVSRQLVGIFDV
ncbi:acyl-CoA thioesterase [Neptunicella marina]|uniref:Thioesterase family protein n=1 Tax=Neptunicella marina TaxID=2125989 RepID=A0A8J6ITC4_9ALTE|nr:thioesterase family protein [Neptunicella marina]MBC3765058.1 thioesterase family protein [Neptunicella marina]